MLKRALSFRIWWAIPLLVIPVLLLFLATTGQAHIIREEPWHPIPRAYLRSLFYLNLEPVDWELIAQEYESFLEPGYDAENVYELLRPAEALSDVDPVAGIQDAIENEDPTALHAASTRAVSQITRVYLAQAADRLNEPGAATRDVQRAQQVYRAFGERFLPQADSETASRLGRAWLDLSSSVGSASISGLGGVEPDPAKFDQARQVIEGYLIANFEADQYDLTGSYAPVPATVSDVRYEPWLPPGANLNDQDPLPLLALNFEERGFDEKDLFLVAYGDMLFDSPEIFGDPARGLGLTCSVCHNRSDINREFFIPGVSHQPGAADVDGEFFNPQFNDQRSDSLDIPSLRGIRFTAPYGRDGRFDSLREFTRNVIVNEFAGEEPTPFMLDALVAYMLEFDWQPNSLLSPDGTLNENAPEAARRGEVLFNQPFDGMGGRACSTCHIPSANFIDRLPHDIGSGERSSPFARDTFFDTPTLINSLYTAPYFHDGSLETLADVTEWFDNQFDLGLTENEKADLTAYLMAVGAADTPWEIFDEENTVFALAWAELSTFLSTLDTLIEIQDGPHTLLLLDTVTPDLRADASGMTAMEFLPQVFEIADKLDEIRAAVAAEDWELAARLNEEYKALAEEYGPNFR